MTAEEKLHEIELRVARIEINDTSQDKRLDEHQREIKANSEVAFSIREIAIEMKAMRTDMTEVKDDVKKNLERIRAIEHKPAKKWDAIVEKVLMVVVAGVVAYFMSHFGM